ncbi:MAG: hypothetical protein R2880_05000 [Deinococcales bacterium]
MALDAKEKLGLGVNLKEAKRLFVMPVAVDKLQADVLDRFYQLAEFSKDRKWIKAHLQHYLKAYLERCEKEEDLAPYSLVVLQHVASIKIVRLNDLCIMLGLGIEQVKKIAAALGADYWWVEPLDDADEQQRQQLELQHGQQIILDILEGSIVDKPRRLLEQLCLKEHHVIEKFEKFSLHEPRYVKRAGELEAILNQYLNIYDNGSSIFIDSPYFERFSQLCQIVAYAALSQESPYKAIALLEKLLKLRRYMKSILPEESLCYAYALERNRRLDKAYLVLKDIKLETIKDKRLKENIIAVIASVLSQLSPHSRNESLLQELAQQAIASQEAWAKAEGYQALGRFAVRQGYFEEAMRYFEEARRWWNAQENRQREVSARANIAITYERMAQRYQKDSKQHAHLLQKSEEVYSTIIDELKTRLENSEEKQELIQTRNQYARSLMNRLAFHHDHRKIGSADHSKESFYHRNRSDELLKEISEFLKIHEAILIEEIHVYLLYNQAVIFYDRLRDIRQSLNKQHPWMISLKELLYKTITLADSSQLHLFKAEATFLQGLIECNRDDMQKGILLLKEAGYESEQKERCMEYKERMLECGEKVSEFEGCANSD